MERNLPERALRSIFSPGSTVIDIGGGLRIDSSRNNRKNDAGWPVPAVAGVHYKVLDKVTDFNPDIVGDIHALPFPNDSIDAIVCISVLEHVEEPSRAMQEMYRVLKPGGKLLLYVPFLFYYHPEKGYYQDFYRFTIDGVRYLTKEFSSVEIQNGRGPLATAMNLIPQLSKKTDIFNWLDRLFGKAGSNQTSGYTAFCIK